MTSYCLYNFIVINLADVSRFLNLVLKNVLFVNFHQLNGKLWLVLHFYCNHIPNMGMSRDVCL